MISKAVDYSLRGIVYMASHPDRQYFGVKELAKDIRVSPSYLGKVLQTLVKKGYLRSVTGPGGGFGLARNADSISLMDLITAIDGKRAFKPCFLGRAECNDANPCPIHDLWKDSRDQLMENCQKTMVTDVLGKVWPQYLRRAPKGA